MKKLLTVLLAVAMVATLFVGCGSNEATEAAKAEESKVLTIATAADASSMDPHLTNDLPSNNIFINLYENLLTLDENGELVGQLAESWEKVDDLSYRFNLRKGVKFHNGEELKASDVKFSLLRAMNIEGSAVTHVVGEIDPEGFVIEDDYTIVIKIKQPFSVFLTYLTHVPGGSILNEKAVTEAGDAYAQNPVGTGPLKFKDWTKGDRLVLEKFEEHWGVQPAYDEYVFRAIPEDNSRTIELEAGNVDVIYGVKADDIIRIDDNPDLKMARSTNLNTQYMGFNCQRGPLADVKVRQAISKALTVDQIVTTVLRGVGSQATGPISPSAKYYNTDLEAKQQNIEEAKALLAEAGYPDGFDTTLWLNDKKVRVDMSEIIQNQLKAIGINVDVKVFEWSTYYEALKNGEIDLYLVGWTMSAPDPDFGLFPLFHTSNMGTNNFSFYSNEEVDAMLEKGRLLEDGAERKQLYLDLQAKIYEESPWVFLYNGEETVGLKAGLEGFRPSPLGTHIIYNIK